MYVDERDSSWERDDARYRVFEGAGLAAGETLAQQLQVELAGIAEVRPEFLT